MAEKINADSALSGEDSEKFEPGAARHGNFINYYQFNPPGNRISVLKDHLNDFIQKEIHFDSVALLDVGCNSGELTRAVYNLVASDGGNSKAVHMMGVDLDPVLVQRATEQQLINPKDAIEFQSVDVMTARGQAQLIWRQYLERTTRRQKFDFVFCFSTTMWVHLNYGDEGLKDLLKFLAEWAENVIVEPQPWKCYRNAVRRMKRADVEPFPLYESLRYRSNILQDIEDIFCHQLDMRLHRRLGHSEWKRPVLWFRRPSPQ